MRKFFIIVFIIILLAGFGLAWYLNQASSPSENLQPKLTQLSAEPVVSAVLSFNEQAVWYFTTQGRLFRKDLVVAEESVEEYVLPEQIVGITDVIWRKANSDFIVEYTLDGHTRYKLYDTEFQKFVDLPSEMRAVTLLAGVDKIAYDWVTLNAVATTTLHELKVSDFDSENFTTVMDLTRTDYAFVGSPQRAELVAFTPHSNVNSSLVLIDTKKQQLSGLDDGEILGAKFSPDGSKLLISKKMLGGDALAIVDRQTYAKKNLEFAAPFEQTAWDINSAGIYFASSGKISRYDLASSATVDIKIKVGIEPLNLFFDSHKKILFFTDRETGYLYKLDL